MFQRTRLCTHLLLAFGAIPAFAQDAPAPVQRVEITGSSIKRVDSETALPVTVITREQIEKSGAVTVQDLIHHVAASGAMFADTTQGAGYATANANLRGLGSSSTLVLLNGRRLANFAFGSVGGNVAVDLNSIPFAALERIEVLRDGASAVYGSDAVGGVINFITRKNFKGGEISIRYGDTEAGIGGTESGGSIAFGLGDPAVDKFNLLITANIQKQTRVKAVDQQWYMRGLTEIPGSSPPTSGRAFPGRFWDMFDTISPGAYVNDGTTTNPNLAGCDPTYTVVQEFSNDDGTPYLTPGGQQAKACRFIYAAALDNFPDSERGDIFARFSYDLGNDTELYAEGSYARNHNIGRVAPVPISNDAGHINAETGEYPHFAMPVTSPYFPRELLETLGYTIPADGTMVDVMLRSVPVGNRINDNLNEQTRFVGGLRGVAGGWDYDTGVVWAQSSGHLEYRGYINEPRFLAALATGNINPFGPMDAAGDALLRSTLMEGPMRESTSTVTSVDAKASRDLMAMAGGQMAVAVGVDLRREEADDKPVNDDYRQGLHIGGEGSVPATKASRNVYAAYSELVMPFAKGVEATVAARYDHYSDFGNTFNPRASIRWQPSREVVLRASAGTGFRAPTLWDVHAPPAFTNTANSLNDPDCPLVTTPPQARCATQFTVRNSSSLDLKPEKSRQWAIGAVLDPMPWLSTTIDYWHIEKKDQIGQVTGDSIMSDPSLYTQYNDRIHRGTDGYITFIDQPVENLGGLRTSGVDLSVRTRWNFGEWGKFGVEFDGTYLTQWEQQSGKGLPFVNYLDTAGDGGAVQPVPRWQHTLAGEWQWGTWGVRLENVFVKGWTESAGLVEANVGVAVDHKVADTSRFNLAVTYTGFDHLTLRAGARNLFDADPPFTAVSSYGSHAAGFAGSFADPRGRIWYAAATYKF
ncbi:TonB-dependent receptor [Ideonella sp.]|uniref:TonB-dependent receptor n=1 Tax=Ideonella sp. TaxID=1929293 RepID=UPI002B48E355|nr:TonB-dependent receptor [Ideonella sp.]